MTGFLGGGNGYARGNERKRLRERGIWQTGHRNRALTTGRIKLSFLFLWGRILEGEERSFAYGIRGRPHPSDAAMAVLPPACRQRFPYPIKGMELTLFQQAGRYVCHRPLWIKSNHPVAVNEDFRLV